MHGSGWRRAGFGVGGLIALALIFLGVVMLSNVTLRGIRWDLTQNRLYTLSAGTQQVLGELQEPVDLYFYFSRDTAAQRAPLARFGGSGAARASAQAGVCGPFRALSSTQVHCGILGICWI